MLTSDSFTRLAGILDCVYRDHRSGQQPWVSHFIRPAYRKGGAGLAALQKQVELHGGKLFRSVKHFYKKENSVGWPVTWSVLLQLRTHTPVFSESEQSEVNTASGAEGHPPRSLPLSTRLWSVSRGTLGGKTFKIWMPTEFLHHLLWVTELLHALTLLPKQLILPSDPKLLEKQPLIMTCRCQLCFFRSEHWYVWKSRGSPGTQRNLCMNTTNNVLPPLIWIWAHRACSSQVLL